MIEVTIRLTRTVFPRGIPPHDVGFPVKVTGDDYEGLIINANKFTQSLNNDKGLTGSQIYKWDWGEKA